MSMNIVKYSVIRRRMYTSQESTGTDRHTIGKRDLISVKFTLLLFFYFITFIF